MRKTVLALAIGAITTAGTGATFLALTGTSGAALAGCTSTYVAATEDNRGNLPNAYQDGNHNLVIFMGNAEWFKQNQVNATSDLVSCLVANPTNAL